MSEPQYDNMRIIAPASGNPDLIAAHRCNDENQYINTLLEAPPPETVIPSRPETPFSEVDEDELSEMFADVIKEGERMNDETTDIAVEIHTPPPTPPTTHTEGFGSVKNLLQRFKQDEQTGIDNRGQDSGLPRAIVQVRRLSAEIMQSSSSSSSYFPHFYVESMYAGIRLHVARSYTSIGRQALLFDIIVQFAHSSSFRSSSLSSPLYFNFHRPPSHVVLLSSHHLSLSLFRKYNTMTILNIVSCVPRVHHVYRQRNTIHMTSEI